MPLYRRIPKLKHFTIVNPKCFTVVNGSMKVYTPAFEKIDERRTLEKTANDSTVMPYGPLPKSLRPKSY